MRYRMSKWHAVFDVETAGPHHKSWCTLNDQGRLVKFVFGLVVCNVHAPSGELAGQMMRLIVLRLNLVVAVRFADPTTAYLDA